MTDTETPETEDEREYQVVFTGLATTYVTVTATNASDAVNAAEHKLPGALCFNCGHPEASSFNRTGDVEREWPEHMEIDEVTVDGATVATDEY